MPIEEYRTLNRLRHHLLRWPGSADAPVVVLLHGYLDLAWSFAPLCEALRPLVAGDLLALDLRGHGASDRVAAGGYYHFADYVADVHALVSDLPRPHLVVGHSMGGSVAALLAGSHPALVDRLVLVEGLGPAPHLVEAAPDRVARWIADVNRRRDQPVTPMADVSVAAARLQRSNPRLPDDLAGRLAAKATVAVEGGVIWAYDPLHRTRSPFPFEVPAFRQFLRRIRCPTLLIEGSESPFREWIPDAREEDVAGLQRHVVAGAGHMIHHDAPLALADALAGFLAPADGLD